MVQLQVSFLRHHCLFFFWEGLPLSWTWSNNLDWLAIEMQGSIHLGFPLSTGIISIHYLAQLLIFLFEFWWLNWAVHAKKTLCQLSHHSPAPKMEFKMLLLDELGSHLGKILSDSFLTISTEINSELEM